jgi:hypothetical protein
MTIIILKGVGHMWNGDLNDIEQVTLYMNTELQKGRSQKEIEMIDFEVNQGVMKNRLTRRGYKKIDNQWILLDKQYEGSNTKVTIKQTQELKQYDNNNTLVITDEKMKNNIINLAKNYDKIMSIVEQYDTQYDKEYDSMTIELPVETIKDFRTSIRINNVVWEQFNKFSEAHKEFTKRDLLSMALKEYMDKFK